MKYANSKGHNFVIILRENEIKKGVISIKNMVTGKQMELSSLDEVLSLIHKV